MGYSKSGRYKSEYKLILVMTRRTQLILKKIAVLLMTKIRCPGVSRFCVRKEFNEIELI